MRIEFDQTRHWVAAQLGRASTWLVDLSERLDDLSWQIQPKPPATQSDTWTDSLIRAAYEPMAKGMLDRKLIFDQWKDPEHGTREEGRTVTFNIEPDSRQEGHWARAQGGFLFSREEDSTGQDLPHG